MDEMHNIFISHYGKDDRHVQSLKARIRDQGFNIRNFSIDSSKHKDGRKPTDAVVKRLLRMRIKWSSTFICLIGPKTHTREWVNYEIRKAVEHGKRIIGVYTHGSKETADLPKDLEKVASNLIGWNSISKIVDIIAGKNYPIEDSDGNELKDSFNRPIIRC